MFIFCTTSRNHWVMLQINRFNGIKLILLNYVTYTSYTVISRHIGQEDKAQSVFYKFVEA